MKVQDEFLQEISPKSRVMEISWLMFITYVQWSNNVIRDRNFRTITRVLASFMLSLLKLTAFTTVICYHGLQISVKTKDLRGQEGWEHVGIPAGDSQHCWSWRCAIPYRGQLLGFSDNWRTCITRTSPQTCCKTFTLEESVRMALSSSSLAFL